MDKLGTITKYYPFIDEESKSILNSLMEESSSYYDFVHRIGKMVLEKQSSEDMVFIAAAQCWYASEPTLKEAILKKYESLASIKPWAYYWRTQERWNVEICQNLLHDIELAIKPPTDKWKIAEILLGHAFNISEHPESVNLLSTAKAILNQEPILSYFEPLIYLTEGSMNSLEGKVSEAITSFRKAHEIAAKSDSVYEFLSIILLGYCIKNRNPYESIDLFEHAYQIAQDLGVPVFKGEALHYVGGVYEILGEYDLAISSQLESLNEYPPGRNEMIFAILSRLYAAIDNGQASLEWADRCLEDKEFHIGYLRKARALIILDRLGEAEMFLDTASQRVLQVGNDAHLARYYFVSGLFDMAKGEFANAMGTLEQAYEILHSMEALLYLNEVLIALAKAELSLLIQSQSRNEVVSGRWISNLENHARTHNMPGLAMQAALLRSELFKSQGQLQDAYETLRRALELTDSLGVKTLRKRITTQMKEISRLLQDEEMVP